MKSVTVALLASLMVVNMTTELFVDRAMNTRHGLQQEAVMVVDNHFNDKQIDKTYVDMLKVEYDKRGIELPVDSDAGFDAFIWQALSECEVSVWESA